MMTYGGHDFHFNSSGDYQWLQYNCSPTATFHTAAKCYTFLQGCYAILNILNQLLHYTINSIDIKYQVAYTSVS